MGSSQQFSLRWNNYLKHITSAFETLRTDEDLVDVTLSCEGKRIRAHKMLLSACSTYFRDLFKENPCQHPVIIFRNVKFDDLAALVDFIYQGEVNVVQEQLDSFMTTAELLAVQGLTDGTRKDDNIVDEDIEIPNEPEVQLRNVSGKVITNHKNNRSPILHSPFHAVDLQHETPPVKRRRYRESANVNFVDKSHRNALSPKESDSIKQDCQAMSDPVEIIPIMPNMKLEMPEYVEQDGSSCSYEEQNASENSNKLNLDESHIDTGDHENKPDISQTFYTNQATKLLEPADQSADIGYLISKPGTSGERMTQETTQVCSLPIITNVFSTNPVLLDDGKQLLKLKFEKKLKEIDTKQSKRYFSKEKVESLIEEVRNSRILTTKKLPRHYWLQQHYDIHIDENGFEKLVTPINKTNTTIRYYCSSDELFDIIYYYHLLTKHGGRDRMVKEIHQKYKNITKQEIQLFINCCDICQKKRGIIVHNETNQDNNVIT